MMLGRNRNAGPYAPAVLPRKPGNLRAIVGQVRLRPAAPASERVGRRVITLVPGRGAEIIAS